MMLFMSDIISITVSTPLSVSVRSLGFCNYSAFHFILLITVKYRNEVLLLWIKVWENTLRNIENVKE